MKLGRKTGVIGTRTTFDQKYVHDSLAASAQPNTTGKRLAPTKGSKTQKRKHNKEAHMKGTNRG